MAPITVTRHQLAISDAVRSAMARKGMGYPVATATAPHENNVVSVTIDSRGKFYAIVKDVYGELLGGAYHRSVDQTLVNAMKAALSVPYVFVRQDDPDADKYDIGG